MAYFETLGQLQSNDEGFIKVWSGDNPVNTVISCMNESGLQIGDIILLVGCCGTTNGQSTNSIGTANVSISGCNKILFSAGGSSTAAYWNGSHWSSTAGSNFIYIGKISQNSITITGSYPGTVRSELFRLIPRE